MAISPPKLLQHNRFLVPSFIANYNCCWFYPICYKNLKKEKIVSRPFSFLMTIYNCTASSWQRTLHWWDCLKRNYGKISTPVSVFRGHRYLCFPTLPIRFYDCPTAQLPGNRNLCDGVVFSSFLSPPSWEPLCQWRWALGRDLNWCVQNLTYFGMMPPSCETWYSLQGLLLCAINVFYAINQATRLMFVFWDCKCLRAQLWHLLSVHVWKWLSNGVKFVCLCAPGCVKCESVCILVGSSVWMWK